MLPALLVLQTPTLTVEGPFGSNMVFPRERVVPMQGRARAGSLVVVSVGRRIYPGVADASGNWRTNIPPQAAGGPLTITIESNGETRTFRNVLVGDVWLCSGQSNMDRSINESEDPTIYRNISDAGLRLLMVPKTFSTQENRTAPTSWRTTTPTFVGSFSAVGFHVGRELRTKVGVPIGIIQATYGGTKIESWTAASAYKGNPVLEPLLLASSGTIHSVGTVWNGMLAPLRQFPIRGALWYQGESNVARPAIYAEQMRVMLKDWRTQFDAPTLPIHYVQLPGYGTPAQIQPGSNWARLREAQADIEHRPLSGMAVTLEYGDPVAIHPVQKRPLALRLARFALSSYGLEQDLSFPRAKQVTLKGSYLDVAFIDCPNGMRTRDGLPVSGFAVAGRDGIFRPAVARISGNIVSVRSSLVARPVAVRYAWANNPDANLVGRNGLPAAPFRSDIGND